MNGELGGIGRTWWGFLFVVAATTAMGMVAFYKGVAYAEVFTFFKEIITWAFTAVIGGKTIEKVGNALKRGQP